MKLEEIPNWLLNLEFEDLVFIKKFITSSGSLKDMAKEYGVTYPTLRLRLNRMIEKIKLNDNTTDDKYVIMVKQMTIDGKIDSQAAKHLISEYRRTKKE